MVAELNATNLNGACWKITLANPAFRLVRQRVMELEKVGRVPGRVRRLRQLSEEEKAELAGTYRLLDLLYRQVRQRVAKLSWLEIQREAAG